MQNLNPTELLAAQAQAQTKLSEYIDTDPTVGDVLGGRRTIVKEYPILPSGLPNTKIGQGPTYALVPGALQNKVGVGIGNSITTFPFAQVNNEKVTFSFKPTTEAALAALLPDGEITDISQLPGRIPSYLVGVTPTLALNGEVFAQGNAMSLGSEIDLIYQLSGPLATYAPYRYSVIAGSCLNVPLIAQSVSPTRLQALQETVEQTRTILESGNTSEIETLTQEEILGDLFYAGGMSYFAQYSGLSHIAALQTKGAHKFEFGYGSYGYEPGLDTFFGIPRGIQTGGAAFNIKFARAVQSYEGQKEATNQLRFQTGLISSTLEHAVPEQMFSDPQNPTDGVSAVKALQLAAQQGQKIYQISQENLSIAMAELRLDSSVEDEIRRAVSQGRIAIAHTDNISVPGWSGAGYLILDPEILDGSYKISGGGNGGWFTLLLVAAIAILSIVAILGLLISGLVAPIFIYAFGALVGGLTIGTLILGADFETFNQEIAVIDFIAATLIFTTLFAVVGFFGVALLPLVLGWFFFTLFFSIIIYRFS